MPSHSVVRHASSGHTGSHENPLIPVLDEDAAASAVEELQALRDKWAWSEGELYEHFHVLPRGGKSTKAVCGSASDCVAMLARAWAIPWCKWCGANEMHSFKYSTHGEEASHLLAREWCRKQNWYYSIWHDMGEPDPFDFSSIPAYHLSDEFYDMLETIPASSKTFKRFEDLAAWRPSTDES